VNSETCRSAVNFSERSLISLAQQQKMSGMVDSMKFRWYAIVGLAWVCAVSGPLPEGVVNTQQGQDKPLSPTASLERMAVPAGFRVQLFAAEPDVLQPIAFDFDDRGRLWVVECFSYPDFKRENQDRVLIFSDEDGDGKFDQRKVFLANGHRLSGITTGFGGVWLCSPPQLIFIADENGDDIPDGPPVAHLDGFTVDAGHNMVNGLAWGPDGWLYGRHGILKNSLVGRPGAPDQERVLLNCSIWRYHPIRKIFEVVAHGTTNPWGLDWDEYGQAFFSNNVIGHLWHLVPGAHYERMYGEDFNPHFYELMKAASDHKHFAGGDWTKSRGGLGEHGQLGGGHAHAGAMIYQGDNWPDEFRQTVMMANIHGNRLLFDRLERRGSGYVARHGDSFLMANDPWFRALTISYGPDGGVFVSDWNDWGECHDYDGAYRTSGRIYKITYGTPQVAKPFDLAKLPDSELVRLQLHKNEWFVRHSRRLLQERHAAGKLSAKPADELQRILRENPDISRKLRALWSLHVIGGLPDEQLATLLGHENEHIRWWALKLLENPLHFKTQIGALANGDPSALVRLGVASALQRLPADERFAIGRALLQRSEDANDRNIPLMIWYGLEPAIQAHPRLGSELVTHCKIPSVRQFIARRVAAAYQLSKN
jgi:putative membrane-bound dehydrogenase-like protein